MSTIYVNNILPTTGDTSTVSGSFKVTGSMQVTGNVFMAGNLTVEGTTTTVNSTAVNVTSSLTFEGPADAHETTLHAGGDGTGAAPSADTTIYLPAMSAGSYYLPVLAAASTTSITSTPEELNLLDGSSAGTVVNSKGVIYSSAGAVHTSIIDGGATVTLSGSTDVRVENDLRLDSDSSVLSMGIGNDATLTHDGTTGLTIAATPVSVNSTGNLTLDSTTDIVLSGSSEVRVENDLRLDSDSAVFSMGAGDDFTITHDGTTGVTIKGEPIVVQKAATTAGAHQEIMRLEIKDEGVDMNIGNGPGIDFYVGETGGSNYGGTVAVIREEASDADSDAAMVFHTATDDQVPSTDRERMRITSAGKVGIGVTSPKTLLTVEGAVTLKEQSAADSDTAAYGQLWVKDDTPTSLYFTTDAGDDIQITSGTAMAFVGDITGVTAGDGLSGGGTSGAVSLALDLDELTGATIADGDSIVFIDANDSNASRKETLSDFLDVVAGTVATTGLDRSGATLVVSDLHPVGVDGAANQLLTDDGDGTVSSEGNLTFNGSILKVVGALSGSGTSHVVGAATFGNNVSMTGSLTIGADSDGTDRTVTFGHSTLKTIMGIDDSADAFVINTDASFDGTLASNSLSIDASHNMIVAGNITGKGRVLVDDATEATSTTDGSLQTDGGLSVAKSAVIGDDLDLLSDGAIISFGTDKEITLTHEADVGLILEGNGQSADPTLTIKNTNADATGGSLKFLKDGSSVADADVIGNITFVSEDDGSNAHTYASIIGSISDMTAGAEGGKLQFNVAEHDGTVTQGLLIADGDADGEIDVTVGAGAASVVTVPGVLNVANDIILDDGGSIKEAGGTAAITINSDGEITTLKVPAAAVAQASDHILFFDGGATGAPKVESIDDFLSAIAGSGISVSNSQLTASGGGGGSTAADDITNGDAAVNIVTTSGNITLDAQANDADIIFKVDDNGQAVTALTLDGSDEGNAVFVNDLKLSSDSAAIHFGADNEITLTHVADTGLTLKHTATADDKPVTLTLATGETDMAANDVIAKIAFQAPDEGTGTDAVLVAAAIQAVSEGDFAADANATRLEFMTAASEAAAAKMTLSSAGVLDVDGGITVDNITIDGTQIDLSSGDLTIDVAGDIILDADDGDILLKDGGTTFGSLINSSGDFALQTFVSDKDIIFKGNDGGATITALTLDMSDAGRAVFNNDVRVGVDLEVLGALFVGAGANEFSITESSDDITLKSLISDKDLKISGNDGGSNVDALSFDMSDAGRATFNNDVRVGVDLEVLGALIVGAGADEFSITESSDDITLKSLISDKDLKISGNDGGANVDALSFDMSEAGAATFNSTVTANAGVIVDNITIDGTEIDLSSGDLTIDVAGDIILDADGADVILKDAGTEYGRFSRVSSDLVIKSMSNDNDMLLKGIDGGVTITALTLDMSDAGRATFNNDVRVGVDCEVLGDLIVGANADEFSISEGSDDITISTLVQDKDMIFKVNDGGSATEVFRLDGDVSALKIASGKELQFADSGEKISSDGTDLTIASGAKINLTATSDIHVPNNVGIVFGGDSEKIEGDGTDLTISANNLTIDCAADLILDAGGNDFKFKAGGTEILNITNSSSDVIIKPVVDAKDIIFQQRDGTEVARIEDNGTFNVVTDKLAINGTAITSTAAELNVLDGITAVVGELNALDLGNTAVGNAIASKAVVLDSNKDFTGIRNFTIDGDADVGDDLLLTSDSALISFGANSEITLTHVHDAGLTITNTINGTDNRPCVLQLKSEEDAIVLDDVIASIEFAAGDSDGTDGATVAAGIHAIAEGTFSASANATSLVFTTGVSETAASSANAKMKLSSIGDLTVFGDTHTFQSENANDPQLIIKNVTNDASGGAIIFDNNRSGNNGANNDVCGKIEFAGQDASGNPQTYAIVSTTIQEATHGQEGGSFTVEVANHDGGLETGLKIVESSADGVLNVELAAGTASQTHTAGRLGVGNSAPKTALDVVHDYHNVTFENQLASAGDGGGHVIKYNRGSNPTLTLGQLHYLNTSGVWTQTDADGVANGGTQLLGIAMGTNPQSNGILLHGFVRIPQAEILNVPTNVDGLPVYVGTEAGHIDFNAPAGAGDFVRIVGHAVDKDSNDVLIWFCPSPNHVEL